MIRAGKIAMYPTAEAGEALLLVGHDGIHLNQLDKRNTKIVIRRSYAYEEYSMSLRIFYDIRSSSI